MKKTQIGRSITIGFHAYLLHSYACIILKQCTPLPSFFLSMWTISFMWVTEKIRSQELKKSQEQTTVAKIMHQEAFDLLQRRSLPHPPISLFRQLWVIRKDLELNQRAILRGISYHRTLNEDLMLLLKYLIQRNDVSLLLGGWHKLPRVLSLISVLLKS